MNNVCFSPKLNLLTAEDARHQILGKVTAISEIEHIPLMNGLGRIVATDLFAPIHSPPEDNSAMDGYGFHSSCLKPDQSVQLEIVGGSSAGHPFTGQIRKDQCIRILTGAVVPNGVDSVIAQEQVERVGNAIHLPKETIPFKNIRIQGSDIRQGDLLLPEGKPLTAQDMGLLASMGIETISVNRLLKIGFFSTGDELVPLGTPLSSGRIYDSNRYQLAALLAGTPHRVVDLGIVQDSEDAIEALLRQAAKHCDLLISSGGASVGDADFIQRCLAKNGTVDFWKIAVKPGKPLAFGRVGNCLFFGLPGNPVAITVSFEQFVKPAIQQLSGTRPTRPLQIQALCTEAIRKLPGRKEYQRGILKQDSLGTLSVELAGGQDSHQQSVSSRANCFIVLPLKSGGIEAGSTVTVEPFGYGLTETDTL
jgi:molybdopterin molybdotransferase